MIRPEKKPMLPINAVKLTKVPNNNTSEQKPKKILINNNQNDLKAINKNLENNDKKVNSNNYDNNNSKKRVPIRIKDLKYRKLN